MAKKFADGITEAAPVKAAPKGALHESGRKSGSGRQRERLRYQKQAREILRSEEGYTLAVR